MGGLSKVARDHATKPRNVGEMTDADGVGTEGKPGGGPFVKIFVKLDGDRIADISFLTYGCGSSIASCSMLTQMVKGRAVEEALGVTPEHLLDALEELPLGKRHCPGMAVKAMRRALENH